MMLRVNKRSVSTLKIQFLSHSVHCEPNRRPVRRISRLTTDCPIIQSGQQEKRGGVCPDTLENEPFRLYEEATLPPHVSAGVTGPAEIVVRGESRFTPVNYLLSVGPGDPGKELTAGDGIPLDIGCVFVEDVFDFAPEIDTAEFLRAYDTLRYGKI